MSIDPFSPFEAGANSAQLPPAPQPFSAYPINPGAAQPFPSAAPPIAPMSAVPGAPGVRSAPAFYAGYGEVPDINEVEFRDYSEADSRLKVFSGKDYPDLEFYWGNSDLDRQAALARRGWRPFRDMKAAASDDPNSDTPVLMAGTQRDGRGRRAILLCRPKRFRELQNENHRRMLRAQQASLDPKNFNGNQGRDAGTFKGQITIDGS